MDKLHIAATEFLELTKYQYHIKLGRKNKITALDICFDITEFHHLSGLKYLQRDMPNLKRKRDDIFNEIITKQITISKLQKSGFFTQRIEERIELTGKIMEILDDENTIFKYSKNQNPYSSISAQFLLVNDQLKYSDRRIFFFLDKRSVPADNQVYELYGRSIFYEDGMDYTKKQARTTVLYKEKINTVTGQRQILIDRLKDTV